VLLPAHLPVEVRTPNHGVQSAAVPTHAFSTHAVPGGAAYAAGAGPAEGLLPLGELERRHIAHALAVTGGHLARAAELLGIHRNTLRRKLQEYGLSETPSEAIRTIPGVDVEVLVPEATDGDRDWSRLGSDFADVVPMLPEAARGPSLSMACNAA
jgi:hypothetical protein